MKQINEIGSFECLSTSQRMTLTSQRSDYVFVFWLLEVENWVRNEKNFLKSRHHWYSSYRILYILDDILWRYRLSFMIQPKMCVGLFKEHKANLFLLPNLLNMAFILWISSESKSFFLKYETILCLTFLLNGNSHRHWTTPRRSWLPKDFPSAAFQCENAYGDLD